ncbi:MAG: adenylate cyclase [Oceanicoccus sp.]|jgi:adenylate cyclase
MQGSHSINHLRFPLFWQILLAMAVTLSLTIGIIWAYLGYNLSHLLQQQTDTFAHAITHQAADSAAEMVMASDKLALASMLDNLVSKNTNIRQMRVFDDQQILLAQSPPIDTLYNQVELNHYSTPILFHDVQAGSISMVLDNSPIRDTLIHTRKVLGVIVFSIGLLALIVSAWLATNLSAPLKRLQKVAAEVANGNLNPDLPHIKNDEAGDLVLSFSNMLQGLRDKESIEHKFSSYISKDIAKGILENLHTNKTPLRSVNGSVLFVDIVGFTQLSERSEPNEITDILNHYYFLLHQAAKMYRGTVDNYIGDGAMLTFGVHKEDHKHSINAICSAQIFIRLTDLMNAQRKEKGLPNLDFRLGLHCGEMLAGTIGSSERMQLTITGDTVNLAARMCEHAGINTLMISDDVYYHPSTHELVVTEPPITLDIKGKANPVNGRHVLHLAPKFNRLLMQQEAEMEAMQNV